MDPPGKSASSRSTTKEEEDHVHNEEKQPELEQESIPPASPPPVARRQTTGSSSTSASPSRLNFKQQNYSEASFRQVVEAVPMIAGYNNSDSTGHAASVPTPQHPPPVPVARAVHVEQREQQAPSLTAVQYRHLENLPTGSTRVPISDGATWKLKGEGFPDGLIESMAGLKEKFPIRYMILDNSGSMRSTDCHRMAHGDTTNKSQLKRCSRWDELKSSVEQIAKVAGWVQAKTIFRFLNDPGKKIPYEFVVETPEQAEEFCKILGKVDPDGTTPLTGHICEIHEQIASIETHLRENCQKAVVILATDGLPSDRRGESPEPILQDFKTALHNLRDLPVWLVVRLCTNDEDVIQFYQNLDQLAEAPVEVIDDWLNEAKEIQEKNRWLNYAYPLHICREMGFHSRIFDSLDEKELAPDELVSFLTILFGKEVMRNAPDTVDWKDFAKFVGDILKKQHKQLDPMKCKTLPWIDKSALSSTYGNGMLHRMSRKLGMR